MPRSSTRARPWQHLHVLAQHPTSRSGGYPRHVVRRAFVASVRPAKVGNCAFAWFLAEQACLCFLATHHTPALQNLLRAGAFAARLHHLVQRNQMVTNSSLLARHRSK
eukprot:scaffold1_cov375-Pavlova_lutheri.AAC.40